MLAIIKLHPKNIVLSVCHWPLEIKNITPTICSQCSLIRGKLELIAAKTANVTNVRVAPIVRVAFCVRVKNNLLFVYPQHTRFAASRVAMEDGYFKENLA